MEPNVWVLGAIGLVGGFVGSLLGVGGGFFVVPMLALALRLPMQEAIGASLVAVVATSSMATLTYLRAQLTNVKLAMALEIATTAGAVAGAFIAVYLSQSLLAGLFGAVMVYVAYTMLRPARMKSEGPTAPRLRPGSLAASYFDRAAERTVSYAVRRVPQGMAVSTLAGLLSGLLGVGGGVVKVPVMNMVMSVPIKAAIATSSYMIGITAVASAFIYLARGYIYPAVAGPVVIGIFFGAWLGARLAWRASGRILRMAFGGLLVMVAATMILKALGVVV